jgi:ferrochelatase
MNELPPLHISTDQVQSAQPRHSPAPSSAGKIAVLLVNLGTPDAADSAAVRRYLREFLSDPRVIEDQGLLWKIVLNGIVLRIRPHVKARDYRKIWNYERNESPLKTITRSQAQELAAALAPRSDAIVVDWAMRYGNPSLAALITSIIAGGCERLLVIPLYPQYCAATTATVCDEVFRVLTPLRFQPALRIATPYYNDPVYIDALASSTRAQLARLDFRPQVLIASFHGVPQAYIDAGDPYYAHCRETTRLLRAALNLEERMLQLTFQSRFGRAKWLEPATIATVEGLAKSGVKNMAVITPGFAADCLETLEEIAGENARVFRESGGENFAALSCLNNGEEGMRVITELAMRELKGWI